MKVTSYESSSYQLIRESGTAYYVLLVQKMEDRYFVIKRSGKLGSPYVRAPFFQGWPVGAQAGYQSLDEAFAHAEKVLLGKLSQTGNRKYVRMPEGEELKPVSGGYERVSELVEVQA